MKVPILDRSGAAFLVGLTMIAKLLTPEPRMLAFKVGNAAWLVTFLSGLIALGGYWCLLTLLRRFPGKSLAIISQRALGRVAGAAATMAYICYFVYLGGIALREFVTSFRLAIMPRTPGSALMLVYIAIVLFVAVKGVETLARMAAYLTPIMLLLFAVTLFGPLRVMDYRGLFPILGLNAPETLLLLFPETSLYSEVLLLGVLAGMLRPSDLAWVGHRTMLIGIVGQTAGWIAIVTVFPYPMSARLSFPMLEVVRMIAIGEVLQRLEALFVLLWFFVAAFKLVLLVCSATHLFAETYGLPDYRLVVPAVALIMYTIAWMPADEVSLSWLDSSTLRVWSWPVSFGLPVLTLLVAALRGKRGASPGQALGQA
jgi:spore germination protein KB